MEDIYSPEKRREVMRAVRGGDTTPEKRVRRLLHQLGYRFRLRRKDLPGRPDVVLPRYRTVVFVHGCFWHRHPGCKRTTTPKTRRSFWLAKFACNRLRDRHVERQLSQDGWKVVVIWECETLDPAGLKERLLHLLDLRL